MRELQISSTLMIPSLLCGFLTHLLLLKNSAAEGMYLIFGMSVCFFQTFLTIGAFNWLKKASPDEKRNPISLTSITILIFVTWLWLFGWIGWYSGSDEVLGSLGR